MYAQIRSQEQHASAASGGDFVSNNPPIRRVHVVKPVQTATPSGAMPQSQAGRHQPPPSSQAPVRRTYTSSQPTPTQATVQRQAAANVHQIPIVVDAQGHQQAPSTPVVTLVPVSETVPVGEQVAFQQPVPHAVPLVRPQRATYHTQNHSTLPPASPQPAQPAQPVYLQTAAGASPGQYSSQTEATESFQQYVTMPHQGGRQVVLESHASSQQTSQHVPQQVYLSSQGGQQLIHQTSETSQRSSYVAPQYTQHFSTPDVPTRATRRQPRTAHPSTNLSGEPPLQREWHQVGDSGQQVPVLVRTVPQPRVRRAYTTGTALQTDVSPAATLRHHESEPVSPNVIIHDAHGNVQALSPNSGRPRVLVRQPTSQPGTATRIPTTGRRTARQAMLAETHTAFPHATVRPEIAFIDRDGAMAYATQNGPQVSLDQYDFEPTQAVQTQPTVGQNSTSLKGAIPAGSAKKSLKGRNRRMDEATGERKFTVLPHARVRVPQMQVRWRPGHLRIPQVSVHVRKTPDPSDRTTVSDGSLRSVQATPQDNTHNDAHAHSQYTFQQPSSSAQHGGSGVWEEVAEEIFEEAAGAAAEVLVEEELSSIVDGVSYMWEDEAEQ